MGRFVVAAALGLVAVVWPGNDVRAQARPTTADSAEDFYARGVELVQQTSAPAFRRSIALIGALRGACTRARRTTPPC